MKDETVKVEVPDSTALAVEQLELKTYDAEAKNFLKQKQILAIILKDCVEEFRECGLKDIEEKYIEGAPEVSMIPVDQDAASAHITQKESGSRITGDANEDADKVEGMVIYDIRFTAIAPKNNEKIKLIINVESQREFHRGYPITKRAVYYCGRLISAQKNVEFFGEKYGDLKKVYSIWICPSVPKDLEYSILVYELNERVARSRNKVKPTAKENYDMITVMLLCLGDPEVRDNNDSLEMLAVAMCDDMTAAEKKQILREEFDVRMTETIERTIDNMCDLSYGILEKGEMKRAIKIAKNMLEKGNSNYEEIAELTELSVEKIKELDIGQTS